MHARIRGECVVVDDERDVASVERDAFRRRLRARFLWFRFNAALEGRASVHANERCARVSGDFARDARGGETFGDARGTQFGRGGRGARGAEGGVDHVVLVAPAILGGKLRDKSENARNRALPVFLRVFFAGITASATSAAWCLIRAVEPIVILVLRALVRSERFWIKGLRSAVHASRRDSMSSDWVDGYRRPSIVRGWDAGMFRVVLASVAAANSPREIWRDAMVRARAPERPSAIDTEDAVNALADSGASVLIVHGENDVIVPASNSRALAKLLGAELKNSPRVRSHAPRGSTGRVHRHRSQFHRARVGVDLFRIVHQLL